MSVKRRPSFWAAFLLCVRVLPTSHGYRISRVTIRADHCPHLIQHAVELLAGQVAHEIVDVLRAASRTRGDEQVQDVDRSGHRAAPAAPSRTLVGTDTGGSVMRLGAGRS